MQSRDHVSLMQLNVVQHYSFTLTCMVELKDHMNCQNTASTLTAHIYTLDNQVTQATGMRK